MTFPTLSFLSGCDMLLLLYRTWGYFNPVGSQGFNHCNPLQVILGSLGQGRLTTQVVHFTSPTVGLDSFLHVSYRQTKQFLSRPLSLDQIAHFTSPIIGLDSFFHVSYRQTRQFLSRLLSLDQTVSFTSPVIGLNSFFHVPCHWTRQRISRPLSQDYWQG